MSAADPLVEVRELEMHFPLTRGVIFQRRYGAVRAVDGVSFSVARGETFGIVGESGCGKSTTGRLIMRLLEPTAGQVFFEGEEITHLGRRQLAPLRRDAQMVFQDPYSSLNPRKTVGSIIAEPFIIHPDKYAVKTMFKEDAIMGRVNDTWFNADREGVFYGQCSELCGKDHAYMPIEVHVVSQDKYDAWAKTAQTAGLEEAYKYLASAEAADGQLAQK